MICEEGGIGLSGWIILLLGLIIVCWVIAGHREWHLPAGLAAKISALGRSREDEEYRKAFVLNFEAREFASEDIEREVYIIRKSRNQTSGNIVMNVAVQAPDHRFSEAEREKAKARLERRFPGLTVNFTRKEQEGKDAV